MEAAALPRLPEQAMDFEAPGVRKAEDQRDSGSYPAPSPIHKGSQLSLSLSGFVSSYSYILPGTLVSCCSPAAATSGHLHWLHWLFLLLRMFFTRHPFCSFIPLLQGFSPIATSGPSLLWLPHLMLKCAYLPPHASPLLYSSLLPFPQFCHLLTHHVI